MLAAAHSRQVSRAGRWPSGGVKDRQAALEDLQEALADAALAGLMDWTEVDSLLRTLERRVEWRELLEAA